jgi:2-amino-4-hydroxy-6-hydroxymethyldihydropteridine diphosphokinase
VRCSDAWQSKAVGSPGPDFINLAVLTETSLSAEMLKKQILLPIEKELKRVRTDDKNAPRTIDIDIIIYDTMLQDNTLFTYAHLAVPVAQILPSFVNERGESLQHRAFALQHSSAISRQAELSDRLKEVV